MKVEHRWLAVVGIVLFTVLVGAVIAVLATTDGTNEVFSPKAPEAESAGHEPVEPTVNVPDPEPGAALEVPEIQGWVSDHAGLLSPDERAELASLLCDFEARTQNEFAVLTVPSTGAETIEEFSLRVAREWGVGKKGLDNGLLIVVARDDRAARIECGDGLSQGRIPDSTAREVMDRHLVPTFAEGRWAEGLEAGLQALIAATDQR